MFLCITICVDIKSEPRPCICGPLTFRAETTRVFSCPAVLESNAQATRAVAERAESRSELDLGNRLGEARRRSSPAKSSALRRATWTWARFSEERRSPYQPIESAVGFPQWHAHRNYRLLRLPILPLFLWFEIGVVLRRKVTSYLFFWYRGYQKMKEKNHFFKNEGGTMHSLRDVKIE